MKILGIDPSIAGTGYALLDVDEDKIEQVGITQKKTLFEDEHLYKPELVEYGLIETDSKNSLPERYKKLRDKMEEIMVNSKPDLVSCEDQYGYLNTSTLKKLSHVRGNYMTLAGNLEIDFYIVAPNTAKKEVAGTGNASKQDMIDSVNDYFGLQLDKKQDNEADAIAMALSYVLNNEKIYKE